MSKWGRDTRWRQGHLLPVEAINAFGLAGDRAAEDCAAVVISHDCDLAQPSDAEPYVEIIVGRFVAAIDGNFANCKNPRRLHLEVSGGPAKRVVELEAAKRFNLPKELEDKSARTMLEFLPHEGVVPSELERISLQIWLAARYRRTAFPDEFDRRLQRSGVSERLAKAFKESGNHVIAVFFDVDSGEELIRNGPDDPYELSIILLYSAGTDPEYAESEANKAAGAVTRIFESRCCLSGDATLVWKEIELVGIEVISEHAMTYAQSQQLKKWHADYVSLRADPPQRFLE